MTALFLTSPFHTSITLFTSIWVHVWFSADINLIIAANQIWIWSWVSVLYRMRLQSLCLLHCLILLHKYWLRAHQWCRQHFLTDNFFRSDGISTMTDINEHNNSSWYKVAFLFLFASVLCGKGTNVWSSFFFANMILFLSLG